jgi:hypothetical protein
MPATSGTGLSRAHTVLKTAAPEGLKGAWLRVRGGSKAARAAQVRTPV